MNKLLIICGPTATGKTALALTLAEKFHGDLLVADSRQVYRGMDIGTGKDIPKEFEVRSSKFLPKVDSPLVDKVQYYSNGKINLWGMDLVNPDEEFSVTEYVRVTKPIIEHVWQEKKLSIITGGTGLYIKALTQPLNDIYIPRNQALRVELEKLPTSELRNRLQLISEIRFTHMNHSDQHNPRRLIRAIEQEEWKKENKSYQSLAISLQPDILQIGIRAPLGVLFERIDQRVEMRVQQEIESEIKKLLDHGFSWDLPAMSGLGYGQWRDYFAGKKSLPETIIEWKKAEHDYAKRQLTWFKKDTAIEWYDITEPDTKQLIIARVEKWYTKFSS